ncbi:Predicted Fe-Mo cluster-binding protein, NifX family [Formivibrio citricus]|uniref:Predicted Fe-Mo cluster-binding protein, NifX family n=1 Tax=Formivibrio citricus TaxID=83765 RepID=A0A1I5AEY2_9NEIS|nr:NifB/NifX family molybdenum-iron cluster-binding protein [Formivibrio citricus]SFN60972.1 Predicted Fe-Mo cluster-binding protein, NifX family [Formivibrio citricus]
MKLCMPVTENIGLGSELELRLPHATSLLVFDTDTRQHVVLAVEDAQSLDVDAMLCGSIGRRQFIGLLSQGIQIYGTDAATAEQAIAEFENGALEPVSAAAGCGRHGHGHSHRHEHAHGGGCCGGTGHADDDHECCGGHGHEEGEHECCGRHERGDEHECGHGHGHGAGQCGCRSQA